MMPFKALYGYDPPHTAFPTETSSKVAAVSDYLFHKTAVLDIVALQKAQVRIKWYTDKKISDRQFAIGD